MPHVAAWVVYSFSIVYIGPILKQTHMHVITYVM
jgi:hypothetical protein